mmetsp:Transcript_9371/g.24982  ORF Transcript_9371/g.24982 Transcript_9371/m.24982 type:complete len:211 (-) Transcript_9371:985-1617(-)
MEVAHADDVGDQRVRHAPRHDVRPPGELRLAAAHPHGHVSHHVCRHHVVHRVQCRHHRQAQRVVPHPLLPVAWHVLPAVERDDRLHVALPHHDGPRRRPRLHPDAARRDGHQEQGTGRGGDGRAHIVRRRFGRGGGAVRALDPTRHAGDAAAREHGHGARHGRPAAARGVCIRLPVCRARGPRARRAPDADEHAQDAAERAVGGSSLPRP